MTNEKRESAIKWLKWEIRSLERAPEINGCPMTKDWAEQLEIMKTCLEAVEKCDRMRPDLNKPFTLEQLREMDGQPVWVERNEAPHDGKWFIVDHADVENPDKTLYTKEGVTYSDYGTYFTAYAYAYPPAHIGRKAWTAEWRDHYRSGANAGTGYVCSSCDMWNGRKSHICPSCGKAMDEDGLDELEKRLRG